MKYTDSKYALWPPRGNGDNLKIIEDEKQYQVTGFVSTRSGFVRVFSWRFTHVDGRIGFNLTRIVCVKGGIEYIREWPKSFRSKYCVTLAIRFASDIERLKV